VLGQHLGPLRDGRRRVDHVVDQYARTSLDLADDGHLLDLVGLAPRAALVEERQVGVEILAEALGRLDPSGVGRHHDDVLVVQPDLVLEVVREDRESREVVDGEVEVPLDLPRMEIDGHHAIGPGHRDQVGDQLGRDRLTGEPLLVLARVAVVRDDGGDPLRARALQRVDHDQVLHDRLVHRVGVGLEDEHVGPPHAVLGPEVDLAGGEPRQLGRRDRHAEVLGDLLGQRRMRAAREQHQLLPGDDLHG
jgi:hypothetical protein